MARDYWWLQDGKKGQNARDFTRSRCRPCPFVREAGRDDPWRYWEWREQYESRTGKTKATSLGAFCTRAAINAILSQLEPCVRAPLQLELRQRTKSEAVDTWGVLGRKKPSDPSPTETPAALREKCSRLMRPATVAVQATFGRSRARTWKSSTEVE